MSYKTSEWFLDSLANTNAQMNKLITSPNDGEGNKLKIKG
jgi:hypothetical protein